MHTASRLALFAAATLLTAAGCDSQPPAEAQNRTIMRPAFQVALNAPEGWTWRDLAGDVILEMFKRPAADKPAAAAAVATAPAADRAAERRPRALVHLAVIDREGVTLDAWADAAVKESRELQAGLEETGRQKTKLADGREALLVTLTSPQGLEPLVQRMLLVLTDKRAYALVASAPEPDWPAIDPGVKACFDSLIVW